VHDPKEFLLKLTGRSRKKNIKKAILPEKGSTAKVGKNYNGTLISFLYNRWRLEEAIKHSGSLKRMYQAIKNFQPVI
jgi:hypothetical protein